MSELGLKSELAFHALGVPWQIDLTKPLDKQTNTKILRLVADFEAIFSRFRQDSLVEKLKVAKIGEEIVFPEYAKPLFALYDALFYATKGRIDPCVGAALEILGYTQDVHFEITASGDLKNIDHSNFFPNLSEQMQDNLPIGRTHSSSMNSEQPPSPELSSPKLSTAKPSISNLSTSKYLTKPERVSESIQQVNSQQVDSQIPPSHPNQSAQWGQLRQYSKVNALNGEPENTLVCFAPGISLDFGAVGKGFLIDLLAELLWDAGYDEFVVDASGDFRVYLSTSRRPLRIALEDPSHPGSAIGVVQIRSGAFCSSGITRRRWRDTTGQLVRHHLLNALSGEPTTGVLGAWVAIGEINLQNDYLNDHTNSDLNDHLNNHLNGRSNSAPVPFPYITALCDGLATALFSTSATELQQTFDFEYLVLDSNRRAHYSKGFLAQ